MWASDNQISDFYVKFYEFSKKANKSKRQEDEANSIWRSHVERVFYHLKHFIL